MDFKKAYDSVRREALYNILIEFRIPRKLVGLIKMCLNETYSRVRIVKTLSDKFTIENGLKQRNVYHHCFSTLLWNMPSEESKKTGKLKLNGTHQLMAYADDINILAKT
jgi:hypothetical protein